jgi:hypothetical protein
MASATVHVSDERERRTCATGDGAQDATGESVRVNEVAEKPVAQKVGASPEQKAAEALA